jgi:hypothetical protein
MTLRAFLLPAALLSACAATPEPLPDDLAASLSRRGGCADLVAYAANEGDTLALMIRGTDLVDAAYDADEETPFSFDLATDEGLLVELVRGEHVTHLTCNDAISHEVVITETYAAVSGSALLVITPTGVREPWNAPASAVITLTDLVLETDEARRAEIDELSFTAEVGWLPG